MREKQKGTASPGANLMLVTSMIIFGTISIFVKNIPLGSAEIALYRAVLAVLMLGGYFLAKGEKLPLGKIKRELPILFLSGAAMGMNWIFLFEAYKYTTVSIATLSYYFAPLIVTVLCPLLFHEKLTIKQMICFLMSTVGVVLIIGVSSRGGSSDEKGIFLGLTAACLYASVILLNKCVKTVTGIERTFLQFMAAMFVLFLYTAFNGGFHLDMLTAFGWGNLLVVGLFHTGITYCLYFSSMRNLPGQKVAVLSYIDPLVAVMISVFILGEKITMLQVIGGCLILGFAVLNEIKILKKEVRNDHE